MRLRGRKARHDGAERIYEVRPADTGWLLVRAQGGYRAEFAAREAAVERGIEICRQLAPARLRILDRFGRTTDEVVYATWAGRHLASR